jgi:hypothetical protein
MMIAVPSTSAKIELLRVSRQPCGLKPCKPSPSSQTIPSTLHPPHPTPLRPTRAHRPPSTLPTFLQDRIIGWQGPGWSHSESPSPFKLGPGCVRVGPGVRPGLQIARWAGGARNRGWSAAELFQLALNYWHPPPVLRRRPNPSPPVLSPSRAEAEVWGGEAGALRRGIRVERVVARGNALSLQKAGKGPV